jgi:hypothetical protein
MQRNTLTDFPPPNVGLCKSFLKALTNLECIQVAAHPNAATNLEIGAAEAYKAAVIFSHSPGANVAPAWLLNLNATVQQIANDVADLRRKSDEIATDVADLRRKSDELPILLANSQVCRSGPLQPNCYAEWLGPTACCT